MKVSDTGIEGNREFPSTAWSVVCRTEDAASPAYRRSLERLVEIYWKPAYFFIRRSWARDNQAAKDLTQEFFARHILAGNLLQSYQPQRGSFRALLRTALNNFMRDHLKEGHRQKRGGGAPLLKLEDFDQPVEDHDAAPSGLSAEQSFDAAWNHVVITRALEALEAQLREQGRPVYFDVLRRYDLELERGDLTYGGIGEAVGLSAEQVRHALAVARVALRRIVVDIVREYVAGPEDADEELRRLFRG